MLAKIVSIDEEFEKARTPGAKDKKPRRQMAKTGTNWGLLGAKKLLPNRH
jgi:hypothetical protein